MEPFLCNFMREAVILSDGRVTTCCLDPLAANCFGSIYEDSFEEIARRHAENVRRVADNAYALPRCKICYDKIKAGGFQPGQYKVGFSEAEKEEFLTEYTVLKQLVIEPSSVCNLKCRGCMQSRYSIPDHREAKYLDLEQVLRFLGEGAKQIKLIRLYNYGETFVNKGAIPFIRGVKAANPEIEVNIATNGLLLNSREQMEDLVRSGVNRLFFSMHGSSQETIEPYMTEEYDFEKILGTLRTLVEIKKLEKMQTPLLIWKYLLFEWNDTEEDIQRAKDMAREIGMDVVHFVLPGFPSPSPRFKENPELLNEVNEEFDQSLLCS